MYLDRAGTLLRPTYDENPENIEFERRAVQLECTSFATANYDISIEGLGWFSIQGVGFVDLFINLPFGIRHHIRTSAMRPWEVKDKRGLDRYTGLTVAAKTKKNQRPPITTKSMTTKSYNDRDKEKYHSKEHHSSKS